MLIRLVAINARFVHSAPALFYLRRLLTEKLPASRPAATDQGGAGDQLRLEICQPTINDPYYETLLRLAAGNPEMLFLSVYVWNAAYTRRLLLDLAEIRPDLPVVIGGPQAPHLDLPRAPQELPGARSAGPSRISVVHGPAEGLGPEFFTDLARGRLRPAYQARPDASFAMPYRPEDFAGELRNRHIYYESSRGCPFACSYCLSSAQRGVVYRELEEVFAELKTLLAGQPPAIRFVDRTFNAPPERALAIWRFLVGQTTVKPAPSTAAQPAPVFHFEIAPDLFQQEALAYLATVPPGLFRFEIGLQSFNRASLAAVNRAPDLDRARAAIRQLRAADNIHLHLDLILGLPFETRTSYLASLNEILALRPHHLQLGLLKVLPDTPLAGRRREFGLRCCQEPPYPILATRWLEQPELAELFQLGELIESFYNPRFFLATLDYILATEPDPAAFFLALAATCAEGDFFRRARTQELLNAALVAHFRKRPDAALAVELLRFDWLACGHRWLPEPLQFAHPAGQDRLKETRDQLWHRLPDNSPPWFTAAGRNAFFKRTVFAPFSGTALKALGLDDGRRDGVVGFLPERTLALKSRQLTTVFW